MLHILVFQAYEYSLYTNVFRLSRKYHTNAIQKLT